MEADGRHNTFVDAKDGGRTSVSSRRRMVDSCRDDDDTKDGGVQRVNGHYASPVTAVGVGGGALFPLRSASTAEVKMN